MGATFAALASSTVARDHAVLSLVEIGRQLLPIALRLVVIDPELGLFLGHDLGHALHRGAALLLVAVDLRNAAVVPVLLEVDPIATLPIWSGWLCDTATYLTSEGFTRSCSSWAASVFGRRQWVQLFKRYNFRDEIEHPLTALIFKELLKMAMEYRWA